MATRQEKLVEAQKRAEVARAARPPGSRKGTPNKWSSDIRTMMFEALHRAGGVQYLADRAIDAPGPFLTLLGRMLPVSTVTGDSASAMHLLAAQIISQQMLAQNAGRPVVIQQGLEEDRPVGAEERQRRLLEAAPPTE